jgi:hypothetical protein
MGSLQTALPGPYCTDEGHWALEVDRVLAREWLCAGRLTTWRLAGGATDRLAVVEVAGESAQDWGARRRRRTTGRSTRIVGPWTGCGAS